MDQSNSVIIQKNDDKYHTTIKRYSLPSKSICDHIGNDKIIPVNEYYINRNQVINDLNNLMKNTTNRNDTYIYPNLDYITKF